LAAKLDYFTAQELLVPETSRLEDIESLPKAKVGSADETGIFYFSVEQRLNRRFPARSKLGTRRIG
jgi:hypothetical protein